MKSEVIRLEKGEQINVVTERVGYTIDGPVLVVVIKEESAADATDNLKQNHGC